MTISLYYTEELRKWLRSNPGKVVTLFQISTLFGLAFIKSATMGTAMSGFGATGIYPTDPSIFKECDFLPADTTDIEQAAGPSSKETVSLEKGQLESSSTGAPIEKDNPSTLNDKGELSELSNHDCSPAPGCSWMMTDRSDSAFRVSPKIIMPIPRVHGSKRRTTQRRGKTTVLTDSRYKRELEATIKEKEEKAIAKENIARQRLFEIENQNKNVKAKGISQKTCLL